jgi:RND family efflux transporter MFP subunit
MSDNIQRELTFFGKVFRALLPLLLILAGGAAWSYFKATAPVIQKKLPQREVTMVETMTAAAVDTRIRVTAMGTVTAAREVTLKAQVSGVVQAVSEHFLPGSLVKKGEILVRLDPADYNISVQKARSALADATAALAIEQGSQTIAREELRLLTQVSPDRVDETDLALRKPQLAQARANVASATADLDQALLNLNRTTVAAPFNAMIIERAVNKGAFAGIQESLVTLAGTDEFWVEAMVPLDQLPYIDRAYPGGCPVTISSQTGAGSREGRVIQVTGKVNDSGRVSTVIVAVKAPLDTSLHPEAAPLMLDDYVRVTITGRTLSGVVALPRAALQDNDALWINQDNTLDIRRVSLAWKDGETVYIASGVSPGEQVVTSGLAAPVQGMALKTGNDQSAIPQILEKRPETGGDPK